MSKKLTILFAPLNAHGDVNPSIGIGQVLQKRGHHVVFAIDEGWKQIMEREGFDAEFHSDPSDEEKDSKYWQNFIAKIAPKLRLSSIEQLNDFYFPALESMFEMHVKREDQYRDIIDKINPDIIVIDNFVCSPALTNTKPWVWMMSTNPLTGIEDKRTPPGSSGLPSIGAEIEWEKYRNKYRELLKPLRDKVNHWVTSLGAPPIPETFLLQHSPYMNLYMYPEEIDYLDLRPLPPKWHRFDNFMRESKANFDIPEKLMNKPGKLIYVSMGSIGSGDLSLMTRLVNMLKEIPHKFIISMGEFLEQTQLGDNMWGQPMVPQIKILPFVDLVITHGGNNTVTETFYYGKPMIVMPLFSDQFDNAQRIDETGFGIRLDTYKFTNEELFNSIESLLNNQELYNRMKKISERIQLTKNLERAADLFEQIIN